MNDLILPKQLARYYLNTCFNHFATEPLKFERQELHNHYVRYIIKCNRCGCRLGRISYNPEGSILGYKLGENFPECPECKEE